jgi:phosphohistidine phosphatase SixA
MELYLIRHARAAKAGAGTLDDAQRPLVSEGEAQARRLAEAFGRLDVRFDRLACSPRLRAQQTAAALTPLADDELAVLDALGQGDPQETALALAALATATRSAQRPAGQRRPTPTGPALRLAAVGHEPWLSILAGWLLTGRSSGLALSLPTASVIVLAGEPRPLGMALTGFYPMRAVAALLGADQTALP